MVALGSIFMGITCSVCGSDKVIRAGACGVCTECGTSQGCSWSFESQARTPRFSDYWCSDY